jgi:starvation-inducible outer membrane lipoprotein
MKKMKGKMLVAGLCLMLSACATKPPELLFADGSERVPVNGQRLLQADLPAAAAASSSAPSGQAHEIQQ